MFILALVGFSSLDTLAQPLTPPFGHTVTEGILGTSITTVGDLSYLHYDSSQVKTITICQGTITKIEVNNISANSFWLGITDLSNPWPLNYTNPINGWTWLAPNATNTWTHQFNDLGTFYVTYGSAAHPNNPASGHSVAGKWHWLKVIVEEAVQGNRPPAICPGQSVNLSVFGCGLDPLRSPVVNWSPGNQNTTSITVSPSVTTTYTANVTYTASLGTVSGLPYAPTTKSKSFTVVVNPPPPPVMITPALDACTTPEVIVISNYNANSSYVLTLNVGGSATPIGGMTNGVFTINYPANAPGLGGDLTIVETNAFGCQTTTVIPFNNCCDRPGIQKLTNPTASTSPQFNSGTVSNQSYVIDGVFTVDQALTLNGCTLYFTKGSSLLVNNSLNLLSNSVLQSCDGVNMWDGVLIDGGNLHTDNATIKEALIGIKSINNGQFDFGNSLLENNFIGIQVENYTDLGGNNLIYSEIKKTGNLLAPHASLTKAKYGINIINSNAYSINIAAPTGFNKTLIKNQDYGIMSFQSNIEINAVDIDSCGIGVYALEKQNGSMSSITLGTSVAGQLSCSFTNNQYCGVFAKHGVDVSIDNCEFLNNPAAVSNRYQPNGTLLKVENSYFDNNPMGIMVLENVMQHLVIKGNTLEQTNTAEGNVAILVENIVAPSASWIPTPPAPSTTPFVPFTIAENNIDLYKDGIKVKNIYNPDIRLNVIKNIPSNWNYVTYGIHLDNCPRAAVLYNELEGQNGNIWASHGIGTAFGVDQIIEFNCVKFVGRSLVVGGHSAGIDILNNYLGYGRTGIMVNWGYVGQVSRDEKVNGSWIQMPSDNYFVGSYVNHFYSNSGFANNSFIMRDPSSSDYHLAMYRNPWFNSNGIVNPIQMYPLTINDPALFKGLANCSNIGYTPPPQGGGNGGDNYIDEEAVAMMADTSNINVWDPDEVAQAWLRDQALYRELVQNNVDVTSNAILNSFFNNVSGDIADIEDLEQRIQLGLETGVLQEFAAADAVNQLLISQDIPVQATNEFYEIVFKRVARRRWRIRV